MTHLLALVAAALLADAAPALAPPAAAPVLASTAADVLNTVLVALSGLVTLAIPFVFKALREWLIAKAEAAKNDALASLAAKAAAAAADAGQVGATVVWETYTKAIKQARAGKPRDEQRLTVGEIAEAKRLAIEAAKAALGEKGRELVKSGLGDIDAALAPHIEAGLAAVKSGPR